MQKPIIFGSDYDGTYRRNTDAPSPENIAAVREFRKSGNLFGIVTGRDVYEVMAIESVFQGEYDFILCSSGSACILPPDSAYESTRFLYREYCSRELLAAMYDLCLSLGAVHIHADITGFHGGVERAIEYADGFDPEAELGCHIHYWQDGQFWSDKVGRDALASVEGFTQFTVYFGGRDEALAAGEAIEREFPEKFALHGLGNGFDITRSDISKAEGLRRYAEYAGVPTERIYAAGDGYNDIPMLSAYHGIAMAGSPEEVIAAAEVTADSVAEAIEAIMGTGI